MQNQLPTVETIPADAIVNVEISGGMYTRLHQLLLQIASEKSPDQLKDTLIRLKTEEPKTHGEYHLVSILALIFEIEKKAKEQGKTKMVNVPHS